MPNWSEILEEIQSTEVTKNSESAPDLIRRKYLNELHAYTERNVIAYYSGWLSKLGIEGVNINDEHKNGFMGAVHQLDRVCGLDLH